MEVDLSPVSLRIPQSRGAGHAGARGPSHPPSCFGECPHVQQKTPRAPSLIPPPCPLALEEQVFTMDLGRRKGCFEMALRSLIPLPPVAMQDVKVLYSPPEEHVPGQDAHSPWKRQVGWMLTAGLKFCYFWISDAIVFPVVIKRDP